MDAQGLLAAMITPAVLISASGTLIFSTAARLGRIVDRTRSLIATLDRLAAEPAVEFAEERRAEVERQLLSHARRSRLIQAALTSFYVATGSFVATTISIPAAHVAPVLGWAPPALGIGGAAILFVGCACLIGETRLAVRALDAELDFILHLRALHREARPKS